MNPIGTQIKQPAVHVTSLDTVMAVWTWWISYVTRSLPLYDDDDSQLT